MTQSGHGLVQPHTPAFDPKADNKGKQAPSVCLVRAPTRETSSSRRDGCALSSRRMMFAVMKTDRALAQLDSLG
jgi:hypothetical protein